MKSKDLKSVMIAASMITACSWRETSRQRILLISCGRFDGMMARPEIVIGSGAPKEK
ncbi:hypothetical protein [Chryseobacterium sp. Leaf201]|uniref:hypothetical protein n=1 Tax=Chryseobacterium sp. Leaf201 TaxID=1735672 RepID=UPI0012FF27FA|nr:hypothetical protein [Chryseobacterium sp. Leaf201]